MADRTPRKKRFEDALDNLSDALRDALYEREISADEAFELLDDERFSMESVIYGFMAHGGNNGT